MLRMAWLFALVSAAGLAAAAAPIISPARQAQLRNMVLEDCGSCHGLTLKGGLGKPLQPGNLEGLSDEAVAQIILEGVKGTPMPPWRGLVSDTEAVWIAGELKKGIAP